MRVNSKALMRVAGVRCRLDEGDGPARPAMVAIVTEETVRAARALGREDPQLRATDTSPKLRYGGALAYVDAGDGPSRRLTLEPGEGDGFSLPCGLRFLGRHMLDAERALPDRGEGEGPFLRSLIRSVFRMVAAVPDPDRFPEPLIAQSFRSSLRDSFGEAALPLTDEDLILKSRSDLTRGRIAALDPKHPDALGATAPLARVLDGAGMDVRRDGVEVPGVGRVTRFEARRLLEEGHYRSGLFERLTRTPCAKVEGVVLPLEESRALDAALCGSRLTGAWVDAVNRVACDLTGSGRGALGLSLGLYAAQGRDLLVMTDMVGETSGVALLFSWPTHDRSPVLDGPDGPVYALCPEEVPTREDLIRLDAVFQGLSQAVPPVPAAKQALDA